MRHFIACVQWLTSTPFLKSISKNSKLLANAAARPLYTLCSVPFSCHHGANRNADAAEVWWVREHFSESKRNGATKFGFLEML
jgi:hypothetical protein